MEWHHLNCQNSAANDTTCFDWGWAPASNAGNVVMLKFYNNTVTVLNNTGARSAGLYTSGASAAAYIQAYNNDITCNASATACQGVACYTAKCDVFNNKITMLATSAVTSGRAVLGDGGPIASSPGTVNIYNNKITAGENRAVRYRSRIGEAHDNLIVSCNTGVSGAGCVNIYDNSSAIQEDYVGLAIYSNTFKDPLSGNIFYGRGGKNAHIYSNTLSGSAAGKLAWFETFDAGTGFQTTAQLCNNPSFSVSANLRAVNGTAATVETVVITAYQSGPTDAASTGTVTQAGSCPF
jgi:hypothetical protein